MGTSKPHSTKKIKCSNFTIIAQIHLDSIQNPGNLLKTSRFAYKLDGKNLLPKLIVKGKEYKSTNKLANSDNWLLATAERMVNGILLRYSKIST